MDIKIIKKKIKSTLYSLNTLSGVTSEWCLSPRLCTRAQHTSRLQRWQVVGKGATWEAKGADAPHPNPSQVKVEKKDKKF